MPNRTAKPVTSIEDLEAKYHEILAKHGASHLGDHLGFEDPNNKADEIQADMDAHMAQFGRDCNDFLLMCESAANADQEDT